LVGLVGGGVYFEDIICIHSILGETSVSQNSHARTQNNRAGEYTHEKLVPGWR
jgi:hypothetical protein